MAKKNEVELTFAGDATKLEKAFENVGASAKTMGDDVGAASKKVGDDLGGGADRVGEAADTMDTRMMGTRDLMTGVQDSGLGVAALMKGDMFEGSMLLATGLGDLGSGIFNTVIPSFKALAAGSLSSAVAMVQSAAVQTVAWIKLGIQSLLAAGKVALAWLIAIGPIALVIAAVVGLVVLIVKNWDTVKKITEKVFNAVWGFLKGIWTRVTEFIGTAISTIKDIFFKFHPLGIIIKNWDGIKGWISDQWDSIVKTIKGLPARIRTAASGMWNGIKDAFRGAINWIIDKWNNLSFTLPSVSVFGQTIGGGTISTPNIPRLHEGGIFPGAPGTEGLALLEAGERVTPANRSGGGSTIVLRGDGTRLMALLMEILREAIRVEGGDPVEVLGS